MTLKEKAFWFMGLPFMSVVLWSLMYAIVAYFDKTQYNSPDCLLPVNERTDSSVANCAGDEGFIYAAFLMFAFTSGMLFVIGTLVFLFILLIYFAKKIKKQHP